MSVQSTQSSQPVGRRSSSSSAQLSTAASQRCQLCHCALALSRPGEQQAPRRPRLTAALLQSSSRALASPPSAPTASASARQSPVACGGVARGGVEAPRRSLGWTAGHGHRSAGSAGSVACGRPRCAARHRLLSRPASASLTSDQSHESARAPCTTSRRPGAEATDGWHRRRCAMTRDERRRLGAESGEGASPATATHGAARRAVHGAGPEAWHSLAPALCSQQPAVSSQQSPIRRAGAGCAPPAPLGSASRACHHVCTLERPCMKPWNLCWKETLGNVCWVNYCFNWGVCLSCYPTTTVAALALFRLARRTAWLRLLRAGALAVVLVVVVAGAASLRSALGAYSRARTPWSGR